MHNTLWFTNRCRFQHQMSLSNNNTVNIKIKRLFFLVATIKDRQQVDFNTGQWQNVVQIEEHEFNA